MSLSLKPEDLFAGYLNHPEITDEHWANATSLCPRINKLLDLFEADGNVPLVASPVTGTLISTKNGGWRPQVAPGARNSAHKKGGAADLHDPDARLDVWISSRPKVEENGKSWPDVLIDCDLYQEDPSATQGQVTKGGWCHLSMIAPGSGNRVFIP